MVDESSGEVRGRNSSCRCLARCRGPIHPDNLHHYMNTTFVPHHHLYFNCTSIYASVSLRPWPPSPSSPRPYASASAAAHVSNNFARPATCISESRPSPVPTSQSLLLHLLRIPLPRLQPSHNPSAAVLDRPGLFRASCITTVQEPSGIDRRAPQLIATRFAAPSGRCPYLSANICTQDLRSRILPLRSTLATSASILTNQATRGLHSLSSVPGLTPLGRPRVLG
ncbi:hypothetical protein HDK77DRAFT_316271 [Phyllosticta capitalensis]